MVDTSASASASASAGNGNRRAQTGKRQKAKAKKKAKGGRSAMSPFRSPSARHQIRISAVMDGCRGFYKSCS